MLRYHAEPYSVEPSPGYHLKQSWTAGVLRYHNNLFSHECSRRHSATDMVAELVHGAQRSSQCHSLSPLYRLKLRNGGFLSSLRGLFSQPSLVRRLPNGRSPLVLNRFYQRTSLISCRRHTRFSVLEARFSEVSEVFQKVEGQNHVGRTITLSLVLHASHYRQNRQSE